MPKPDAAFSMPSNVVPFHRRGGDAPARPGTAAEAQVAEVSVRAAAIDAGAAARAVRRRRSFVLEHVVIASQYAIDGAVLGLFAVTGAVHWAAGALYAGGGFVVCAWALWMVLTGRNVRLPDPSLSNVQSIVAIVSCVVGVALFPAVNFAYALFMFAVFVSVTYRMPTWQTNTLWALTSAAVVGLGLFGDVAMHVPQGAANQAIAWLCLAVVLCRCVLLSLINRNAMQLIRERGELMSQTLAQIERLANYDELTGVLNRRSLMRILDDEAARTQRTGTPLSVAIFDLDRFKLLNDTLGHLAGDRALRLFADSAQRFARTTDRFGRHGGEEFLMILTDTDLEKAAQAVERLRQGLTGVDWQRIAPGYTLTFSAGIATYRPGETAEQLLARADLGLYGAKDAGRNCTVAG